MSQQPESPQLPSGAGPGSESPSVDFMRLWGALVKRVWLVGLVLGLFTTGVTFWTFRQPAIYRAEVSLVIDPNPPQVLKGVSEVVDVGSGSFWSSKEYFETQYKVLKSRMVAEKVVARLGLDHDLEFLHIDPRLPPAALARALAAVDPVRMVSDAVIVTPVRESRLVMIAIEDPRPQRAADLANAVAEEYIEQNVDRRLTTTHGASAWLAEQLTDVKKRLEESDKALYQFRQDHDVLSTSMEARQNISSEKLIAINDALTKANLARVEIEARRSVLAGLLEQSKGSEFKAESFKPVADNPMIQEFRREYLKLQSERAELSEKYLEGHPKRIALDERIAKVRSDIIHAIQMVLEASESEYRQASDEEKRLRSFLEGAKQEALGVNKLELQYAQLKRERDENRQVYDLMVKRQKEVDVVGLLRTNNIRLLDPALAPTSPVRPNRPQNVALALVLGLLLGIGLVVMLELSDSTVKSQDDVERGLGLPLLGILPSIPTPDGEEIGAESTARRDLYIMENPNSSIAECARSVRTSLLFSSPDRPFKALLVASTGPREGKTTTAISVGITMAQSGSRVLLVDGDLRRPRLHRTFGVPSSAGLSTMILGEATIADAVKNTGVQGLFLLPAGPVPPNPAELLQSERFGEVVRHLCDHFDRVIFDSPPVGVVTDALVMSTRTDGVMLVLRAGATPKRAAMRGRRALWDVNAHIYGAVLNDVNLGSRAGRYYYYYRYGYYPTDYKPSNVPGAPGGRDVQKEASSSS